MKKIFLILGMMLILTVGIIFTAKNAAAVDSDDNPIVSIANIKNNGEKPLSANEENYKELKKKALSNITEGWFYMRDYVDYDVDAPTEEGETSLVDIKTESWFYINASGMVERSVSIVKTMDGQISQVGVFSNGTSWNTMVDEIRPVEPYLFESFDYGLLYHLKKLELKSEKITKKDGKKIVDFKIKNTEKDPVKLSVYSKKLLAMGYEYIFDDVTGFIFSVKNIAYLEDGTQRDFFNVQIEEIGFNVEPPAEALEYFEIKKNREAQP